MPADFERHCNGDHRVARIFVNVYSFVDLWKRRRFLYIAYLLKASLWLRGSRRYVLTMPCGNVGIAVTNYNQPHKKAMEGQALRYIVIY